MKKNVIYTFLLTLLCLPSISQTASKSKNYITTEIILEEGKTTESEVDKLNYTKKQVTIQYFDGLGRPSETIQHRGGGNVNGTTKDLVTPFEYDDFGREAIKRLPYANPTSDGAYVKNPVSGQKSYYSGKYNGDGTYPYSETKFDHSPLNRILQQGGPGAAWQPDKHPIRYDYGTNAQHDVMLFQVVNDQLENIGGEGYNNKNYYKVSELYKTVTKDENWESGKLHTTEEYKDKLGQIVLKRTFVKVSNAVTPVETYYVYDDFGLLRFVIPPQAVKKLYSGNSDPGDLKIITEKESLSGSPAVSTYLVSTGGSLTLSPGFSFKATTGNSLTISAGSGDGDLIYSYKYDGRKRMIEKKIPGAAVVYMVYDNRDRLVAIQDGEMRKKGRWLFAKYDAFNRPVATGLYTNSQSRSSLQGSINSYYSDAESNGSKSYYESRGSARHGYDNKSFPNTVASKYYLTVTYYDDYTFPGVKPFVKNQNISDESTHNTKVKGQVTGTKVQVLDKDKLTESAQWIKSSIYYDDRYREIESISELYPANNGSNYSIVSSNYDFVGKVEKTREIQYFQGNTKTIEERFEYDHAGRLTKVKHNYNGKSDVLVAENIYDELGQLKTKKLGGGTQQQDYHYNIRGWLTQINDPGTAISKGSHQKFAMKLEYNTLGSGSKLTGKKQYNGNIASMLWRTEGKGSVTGNINGYGFEYDCLNRLTTANYGQGSSSVARNTSYDVTVGKYDLNGNIGSLTRKKGGTLIDNLSYTYTGNQLSHVNDLTNDSIGFKEGSISGGSYSYDLNGNMTTDRNRGLKSVKYNYLNLPAILTDDNNQTIDYIYTANGQKVAKTAPDGTTTYYAGSFIYEESDLTKVLHSEGVVKVDCTPPVYQYYLKDHLGNTRVMVSSDNITNQVNSYYPFGMHAEKYEQLDNKYLYNGKEFQDDKIGNGQLEWYDYGARMYDPSLGRWHTVDPMSESYYSHSPFHFSGNNPLRFLDLNGMNYGDYYTESGKKIGTDKIDDDKNYVVVEQSDVDRIVESGGEIEKGTVGSAVELPDKMVTTGLSLAKMNSEAPNPGVKDTKGGFHEEGGQYGKDLQGNTVVIPAIPGEGDESLSKGSLKINTTNPMGFVPSDFQPEGTYHIHTGKSVYYSSGGKYRKRTPRQEPSEADKINAGKRTSMSGDHYVVGSGNGKLYIYDSDGEKARFPFSRLIDITK